MSETPDVPIGLDDLIRLVNDLNPEGDALNRLSDAVIFSERLGELGDHLVGHFVDQARHAGASWSAIGSSMGVTKQAAQKRFVPGAADAPQGPDAGLFSRFTPRARATITAAEAEARKAQRDEIGTEHLVLGLLSQPGSFAARALVALGVTPEALRTKVAAVATAAGLQPAASIPEKIPFAPRTKKALELSVREALMLMHNYIGTEHILLGVLEEGDGLGARALTELGITKAGMVQWLVQAFAELHAERAAKKS